MAKPSTGFHAFVLDQLASLRDIRCTSMFGGYGLYRGNIFFGMVFRNRLYFKTSPTSRLDYEAVGMKPFRPSPKQTLTSFYEVPVEILEQDERLAAWAGLAIAAGTRSTTKRRPRSSVGRRAR